MTFLYVLFALATAAIGVVFVIFLIIEPDLLKSSGLLLNRKIKIINKHLASIAKKAQLKELHDGHLYLENNDEGIYLCVIVPLPGKKGLSYFTWKYQLGGHRELGSYPPVRYLEVRVLAALKEIGKGQENGHVFRYGGAAQEALKKRLEILEALEV